MARLASLCFAFVVLSSLLSSSDAGCRASISRFPFWHVKPLHDFDRLLPKTARTTRKFPVSASDTLVVYEMGDSLEPDTRVVVVRDGKAIFEWAAAKVNDEFTGGWRVMQVARLCSDSRPILYVVLQRGNAGGAFVALRSHNASYEVSPLGGVVTQGRLVLSESQPNTAQVWSARNEGQCGACDKQYEIQTFRLEDTCFRLVAKRQTARRYAPFQDHPLVVKK